MSLGPEEILVILVVALIVFGPKRLPEIGRQIGGAMRELRKVQDALRAEVSSVLHDDHDEQHGSLPPDYELPPSAVVEPADHEAVGPPPAPAEHGRHLDDPDSGPPGSFS
jgi:TatA/E family protein of Tat protein translocase